MINLDDIKYLALSDLVSTYGDDKYDKKRLILDSSSLEDIQKITEYRWWISTFVVCVVRAPIPCGVLLLLEDPVELYWYTLDNYPYRYLEAEELIRKNNYYAHLYQERFKCML